MSSNYALGYLFSVSAAWLAVKVEKFLPAVLLSAAAICCSFGDYQAIIGCACLLMVSGFLVYCHESKTIKEQYEDYNVRMFDFRIDFNKNNNILIKHGLAVYNISTEELMNIFEYLNNKKGVKYINIVFECSPEESINLPKWKEECFKSFCEFIENNYKNIRFIGGDVKYSWYKLYRFKNKYGCYRL